MHCEDCEHSLAIACRRGRRVRVLLVCVHKATAMHLSLPQALAVRSVVTQQRHRLLSRVRCRDEHSIAADDRSRMSAAGHIGSPQHILGAAPFQRRKNAVRDVVTESTAPHGPVVGCGRNVDRFGGEDGVSRVDLFHGLAATHRHGDHQQSTGQTFPHSYSFKGFGYVPADRSFRQLCKPTAADRLVTTDHR